MCQHSNDQHTNDEAAFAAGLENALTERRTLLKVAGSGLLFSTALGSTALGMATPAAAATTSKRAYVLVIDGCRPEELDSGWTPTLKALRDGGTWYPRAMSQPIMETIPNHVMMMTGVRPDRNGVPANSIFDGTEIRDMDRATDIRYKTIIEQLNATGRTTGTVLSKDYLYGIFGTRATHRWEPSPLLPLTDHAPDLFTIQAAIDMVTTFDPKLVFINLGDIDRMGHADLTGTTVQAARQLALADTDQQVKRFVDHLKATGKWTNAMLVVLADHSMDWSRPDRFISLSGALEADPLLTGKVEIAQNGGAELLYWRGGATQKAAAIAKMVAIARGTEGVLAAYDRAATPGLRLGPNAGDVIVYCRSGWRFTDPNPASNPIPGNHGHPSTRPIPFFISGGHPAVATKTVSSALATTVDVTPTLGEFFGLKAPSGSWDGISRL